MAISLVVALTLLGWTIRGGEARAGTFPVHICAGPRSSGDGLTSIAGQGISAKTGSCPYGLELQAVGGQVPDGAFAGFKVTAPPGIAVQVVSTSMPGSVNVGSGKGWFGEFYWNGGPGPAGRAEITDAAFPHSGCCSSTRLNSQSLGWFIQCKVGPRCANGADVVVSELDLLAEENATPTISPDHFLGTLWTQGGWVRGTWPAGVTMSDPSGVCTSQITFGSALAKPDPDQTPNRTTFIQCSQNAAPASFNTATVQTFEGVGEGTQTLTALATNAAGLTGIRERTVQIDNSTPTLELSGPTDAASTAGTQYVTAAAGGSPSGIARIVCTVDGGPPQTFGSASAQVPVSGIGEHQVSCYAENNALDPNSVRGRSATRTWGLKIGEPTELGLAFERFVGGLHCARKRIRQRIPGHWVTIHRHGDPVWVKTKARTVVKSVTRCHPTTALRRTVVLARVKRNGRLVTVRRVKVQRVVVPPHTVANTKRRVAFGRSTVVSGWLGTSSGTGLANRTVTVITAPDDGHGAFTVATRTETRADGGWSAALPPGPSRVVEARYDGDGASEGASSGTVRVAVPARIRLLSVRPSRVRWGGTVRIRGELRGGYLPGTGALVRLRIGIGRSYQTYGVAHVKGSGRFSTTYTFGLGDPSVRRRYFFQIATLPEGDYPFAPGASGRRTVTVGGRG